VFGTLVIQGLTLRLLMLALNFKDDGSVKREVDYAMRATAEAAIQALENEPSSEETDVVRREYQARLNSDGTERPTVSSKSLWPKSKVALSQPSARPWLTYVPWAK
jgi:hypothetical protein